VRRVLLAALLSLLALAACGNDRVAVTELVIRPSADAREHRFRSAGLTLSLPANMDVRAAGPPGVFRAALGEAVVSGFAYRRREQLPRTDRQLEKALDRLEKAAEERSPSFDLRGSSTLRVDGARALELLGQQRISQSPLRIRSLHVFEGGAEYVIELLAPPGEFRHFDRVVTPLLRRTLEVTGEVRRSER